MITLKMVAALVARDSRFWVDPMIPEADDFLSDQTREDRLASWFGVAALGSPVPDVPLFDRVLEEAELDVSQLEGEDDVESFLIRGAGAAWIYEVSDVGMSSVEETLDNCQTEYMSRVDPDQTDRVLCEVVGLTSTEGPLFRLPLVTA